MYAPLLNSNILAQLQTDCRSARRRLFLLDYDGTLAPFADRPELALPSVEVYELLTRLSSVSSNDVILISGRIKESMEEWFGHLPLRLMGEHGAWLKEPGGLWQEVLTAGFEWKDHARRILQDFIQRTPGSFLEEKRYSLVWHYRPVEPLLAARRLAELREELRLHLPHWDAVSIDAACVLEIRSTGIGKGYAVRRWLDDRLYDFILAMGDDIPDEEMFRELPPFAYSVKVRHESTCARYSVDSVNDVLLLLRSLSDPF